MRPANINDIVFLENNRIIYSGVKSLYRLWRDKYRQTENFSLAKNTLKETVKQQWEACFPNKETSLSLITNTTRYQNPLNRFFRFLRGEQIGYISDSDEQVQLCQIEATNMLQLYHIISTLQHCTETGLFSDYFESLCDCMSDIMGSDICYILYSQRDQTELLSKSSFPADMISSQLKPKHYSEIRTQIQRHRSKANNKADANTLLWHAADTIYVPYAIDGKDLVVIVLDYPKYPKTQWKGEWIYLVFQYKQGKLNPLLTHTKENVAQGRCDLLTRSRNMLFLRQDIFDECCKKMYILLMGQRSYQFVHPLNDSKEVHILHLTDLHLDSSKKEKAINFSKAFSSIITLEKPIDLLVITGDVVQANASAGVLEKNYRIAEEFIQNIALNLWCNGNGKIRSDWQKRIVIVPGNHDYASMNELETMFAPGSKRATALGYPAKNEGGPMVKFAYYISFICRLLGLELADLIENDLNELRCYRELGLSLLALNTVSQIGPLRTNKVLMDEEVIDQFSKVADMQDQFKLLLCHHGPKYRPDYLMDRYWFFSKNASTDTQRDWIYRFWACMKDIKSNAANAGAVPVPQIKEALNELANEIATNAKLDINCPEKNALLWDVVRVCSALSERDDYNEQIAALYNSLNNDYEMTERDRNALQQGYRQLLQKVNFYLSLAGHTHELSIGGQSIPENADFTNIDIEAIPFVEGDLLLKDDAFNMGLIVIDKNNKTIEWQMKVSSPTVKTKANKKWYVGCMK